MKLSQLTFPTQQKAALFLLDLSEKPSLKFLRSARQVVFTSQFLAQDDSYHFQKKGGSCYYVFFETMIMLMHPFYTYLQEIMGSVVLQKAQKNNDF